MVARVELPRMGILVLPRVERAVLLIPLPKARPGVPRVVWKEVGGKGGKDESGEGGKGGDYGSQRCDGTVVVVDEDMLEHPVDVEKFNQSMFRSDLVAFS